jgi:hypothetical protein
MHVFSTSTGQISHAGPVARAKALDGAEVVFRSI